MPDRTNRRELIIETATHLFMQHGYDGTSVRQIAEETGMTEAALYYHFKDGKRALFQAVVECQMPDMMAVVERCDAVQSLPELARCFVQSFIQKAPQRMDKLRWLVSEYPKLSQEERDVFHARHHELQQRLCQIAKRFLDSPAKADAYAWTLICASIGYAHLFIMLEMHQEADFSTDNLLDALIDGLGNG